MIVAAEYHPSTQTRHAVLEFYTIVNGNRGSVLKTIAVSGAREARKVALANNATPWNF